MSSHASSWAKAQRTGPGTPARKCVLMVLADYTNSEGIAYPSRETIAEEAGEVSLDTVDRCIRDLVALGLVLVERRKLNGKQLNNVYRLNVDLGRQKSTLRDNRLEEASGPHIAARLQEPDPEDQGGLLETVEAVAAGPHIAA